MVWAPCGSGLGGDRRPAVVEGCQKFAAIQIPADEDETGYALIRPPRADEIPFKHHIYGLERQFPLLSGNRQDALGAQNVGAVPR